MGSRDVLPRARFRAAQRRPRTHTERVLETLLLELASLFALCVGAGVLFQRLRLPPIAGFLAIGALVGPHAIGLVQHEETVRQLAEVGVVVLLFAVGMEVPLGQLARLRRPILIGGGIQIVGTILLAALACLVAGLGWNQAVFLGFLLSLSSTAAITKILVDHGEFSAPHGRFAIAIAIAQDLAVVPMILLIPLLAGRGDSGSGGILHSLENFVILGVVLAGAWFLLPRILDLVCRTRSRELFVLTLATLCLAMAAVTAHLGLSLALGAFLAGILLADSEYHGQAVAETEPFRDALASLFFVSIGMLFDAGTIVRSPLLVAVALVAVILGKAAVIAVAGRVLGQPNWVRWRSGLLLAQVGEFSFVLAQVGGAALLPQNAERVFMVVAVLSIAATPLLHGYGRWLVTRMRAAPEPQRKPDGRLADHAIVVGYGPTGRTLLHSLRTLGIPAIALEMNSDTVRAERQKGVPIRFGDATRVATLRALGIEQARLLILAVNDTAATRRIAEQARRLSPHVHVIARAVYLGEVEALHRAGAHEVVPQELEASVEMLARSLRRFLVADDEIGRQIDAVRHAAGELDKTAQTARLEAARISEFVPGIGIEVHRVGAGSAVDGKTLAEVGVRRLTGCSVVAVRRGGSNLPAVTPETLLQAGDAVVVVGPQARLADAAAMFHAPGDVAVAVPPDDAAATPSALGSAAGGVGADAPPGPGVPPPSSP